MLRLNNIFWSLIYYRRKLFVVPNSIYKCKYKWAVRCSVDRVRIALGSQLEIWTPMQKKNLFKKAIWFLRERRFCPCTLYLIFNKNSNPFPRRYLGILSTLLKFCLESKMEFWTGENRILNVYSVCCLVIVHRLPTMLRESNVFTGGCLSVYIWGVPWCIGLHCTAPHLALAVPPARYGTWGPPIPPPRHETWNPLVLVPY